MIKKRFPRFLLQFPGLADPSAQNPLTGLGKPVWVRGQVRVSVARVERVEKSRRSRWLVQGDHLHSAIPLHLQLLQSA